MVGLPRATTTVINSKEACMEDRMEDRDNHPDRDPGAIPPSSPAPLQSPPANDSSPRRKATLLDLARYRVGQRVFWIVFRFDREPEFDRAEDWMKREHPWVLWQHKIVPTAVPMKPPRTHPGDTFAILMLLGQKPQIEPFRITEVERSPNSGTFLYKGPKGMVMPEGLLFPSKAAASKEVARLAKLFAAWTGSWQAPAERPPLPE
jgi:hypothetical protein